MVTVSGSGATYLDNILVDNLSTGKQKPFIILGRKFIQ